MFRFVLVATLLCIGASVAHADKGTLPDSATITFGRLRLHENNSPDLADPITSPDSTLHAFNLAHCVCSQPSGAGDRPDFFEGSFGQEVLLNNQMTPIHHPLEIWGGAECDDDVKRPLQCKQLALPVGIADLATLDMTNGAFVEPRIYDLITAKPGSLGCDPASAPLESGLWAVVDSNGDATPDYFVSKTIGTDIKAPILPTSFRAQGAENAIQISWTAPADASDIFYYQALCATASGSPAKDTAPAAQFVTAKALCDGPALFLTASEIDVGTADPDANMGVTLPDGLALQDPAFICGESAQGTATSMRIEGLENGTPYVVALLAIDKSGNAAGTYFTTMLTPHPATDLWEDLHDQGSKTEGGFCLIAETFGDDNPLTNALRRFRDDTLATTAFGRALSHAYYGSLGRLGAIVHGHGALRIVAGVLLLPLVAIALLWHVLTLPGLILLIALVVAGRRRRRILLARLPARVAATAALVLVLGASSHARAQTPYWDDQTTGATPAAAAGEPGLVKWHVGVRVGPYVPQIDAQLGVTPGPYKAMFGGYSILPMLDVDRVLWRGFGQVAVGGNVGYMGKSAHAFEANSDPADPNRPRSSGDSNAFRLIPLAATVSYRFTFLDDEYGIPLVPYARGGLAYYVWWIKAPNGDFAKVCNDGGMEPSCSQNTAAGASLGFQGSIGLAIRAERIDQAAANSMRDGGIEHAGFYAELDMAKVDGFGSSKKLAVGDTTWFAGVDFEF